MTAKMKRRDFITLLGGAGSQLAFPYGGTAQQAAKMSRLSDVIMGSPESSEYMVRALTEGLSQLGYENGQNIALRKIAPRHKLFEIDHLGAFDVERVQFLGGKRDELAATVNFAPGRRRYSMPARSGRWGSAT